MTSSGTTCSRSKPSAQMPIRKPNRLKVAAVSSRKVSIQNGWAIRSGTNRLAVARMISPRMIDLVAGAPSRRCRLRGPPEDSFSLPQQVDEDVLQRALRRVEVLEPDSRHVEIP